MFVGLLVDVFPRCVIVVQGSISCVELEITFLFCSGSPHNRSSCRLLRCLANVFGGSCSVGPQQPSTTPMDVRAAR
jgi:hypothetical protein